MNKSYTIQKQGKLVSIINGPNMTEEGEPHKKNSISPERESKISKYNKVMKFSLDAELEKLDRHLVRISRNFRNEKDRMKGMRYRVNFKVEDQE